MTWEAGWRYGMISTVMVGIMVSYLRLWSALWYHIYGYGWRYGIISTVGVLVSYLRLALWYHIYGYGWRYGIISTVGVMVSYLRFLPAKNIQTNNLISENILSFHQFNRPPVSSWTINCFDVYAAPHPVTWVGSARHHRALAWWGIRETRDKEEKTICNCLACIEKTEATDGHQIIKEKSAMTD